MPRPHRARSPRGQIVWRGYVRALEGLVGTLLIAAVGVTFANVVNRYLGYGGLYWADETARRLLVWLTFVGSALAVVRSSHLRIDAIIEAAGPKVKLALRRIVALVSVGFFLLLLIEGGRFAITTMDRVTPGMSISTAWTTGIFPIGGALLLISFLGRSYFGSPASTGDIQQSEQGGDQENGDRARGVGGY